VVPAPRGGGPGGGRQGGANADTPAPVRVCPVENADAAAAPRGGGPGGGRQGGGRGNALLDALTPERRAEYDKRLADINAKYPVPPRATVKDFINHIDYLVKKIGIDHVGISSDFDGGGGVDGWNHAGESFNVTIELVRRGYTEEQIGKIWSGNLLRVWEQVERVAGRGGL
jgi:membrane dipeptidase